MSAALPGSGSRTFDEFSNTSSAEYSLPEGASYLSALPEDRRTTSQTRSDDGSLQKSFKERLLSKVSATALLIPVISAGVAAGGIVLGAGEAQAQAVVALDGGAYPAIASLSAYPGFAGAYYPGTLNIGPTTPTTVNAFGVGTGIYEPLNFASPFWTINVYAGSGVYGYGVGGHGIDLYTVGIGGPDTINNFGTIYGYDQGVRLRTFFPGFSQNVTNFGTIIGYTNDAVYTRAASSVVTNMAGAFLNGGEDGATILYGTIRNSGTIRGSYGAGALDDGRGVRFRGGGADQFLYNYGTGVISSGATGDDAVEMYVGGGVNGYVYNAGQITALNIDGVGISGPGGGTVVNTGSIEGAADGVDIAVGYAGAIANNGNFAAGPGAYATVFNTGKITGNGGSGVVINGGFGAVYSNTATGIYGSVDGVLMATGGAAYVYNVAGYINGATGDGVHLTDGGEVTNLAGGSINGGDDGIYANGSLVENAGTIVGANDGVSFAGAGLPNAHYVFNYGAGTITGTAGDGVNATAAGVTYVSNIGTAVIMGDDSGVALLGGGYVGGSGYSVFNTSNIYGSTAHGVYIYGANGDIYNSGIIGGSLNGVFVINTAGYLRNSGIVAASLSTGVNFSVAGSTIRNEVGGKIYGYDDAVRIDGTFYNYINNGSIYGNGAGAGAFATAGSGNGYGVYFLNAGAPVTFTNYGLIDATDGGAGVFSSPGAFASTIRNDRPDGILGASIIGGARGVRVASGTGYIYNGGQITATAGTGVWLDGAGGGKVTNYGPGTITGTGAGGAGVTIPNGPGDVTNFGNIYGGTVAGVGSYGVLLTVGSGGAAFGTSVNNLGYIAGRANDGVAINGGVGYVRNSLGATIYGRTDGIDVSGVVGTVYNIGTIQGFNGDGVNLDTTASTFKNVPGSVTRGGDDGVYLYNGTFTGNSNRGAIYGNYGAGASGIGNGINFGSNTSVALFNRGTIDVATGTGAGIRTNPGGANSTSIVNDNPGAPYSATINGSGYGINVITGTGTVTNHYRITAANGTAIRIAGGYGQVTNNALIAGYGGDGIDISGGLAGRITNNAGASIIGSADGISFSGVAAGAAYFYRVNNYGLIQGVAPGLGDAIYSSATAARAYVHNYYTVPGTGIIAGDNNGIYLGGGGQARYTSGAYAAYNAGFFTILNTTGGLISGVNGDGVGRGVDIRSGPYGQGTVSVMNAVGATIVGDADGVYVNGPFGIVYNFGNIIGNTGYGVWLRSGGLVANYGIINGALGNVKIDGYGIIINGLGAYIGDPTGDGIYMTLGGIVRNSGEIFGGAGDGVRIIGGNGSVFNTGTGLITGVGGSGVRIGYGGSAYNVGGQFFNAFTGGFYSVINYPGGRIYGVGGGPGDSGIGNFGGNGAIYNAGTVSGYDGVYGGPLQKFAYLVNRGTITGNNRSGVHFQGGGRVYNAAASTISGPTYGVYIYDAAVYNFGNIIGGTDGVNFPGGGKVFNYNGASILGVGDDGIDLGLGYYVRNWGYVFGGDDGIETSGAYALIINDPNGGGGNNGRIVGLGGHGINASYYSRVNNTGGGQINGVGFFGNGINLTAGGYVYNNASNITGFRDGIHADGVYSRVRNDGFGFGSGIYGILNDGIYFTAGGYVYNATTIQGGGYGINARGAYSTVRTIGGFITGNTDDGIYMDTGGFVYSVGTTITGSDSGIEITGGAGFVFNYVGLVRGLAFDGVSLGAVGGTILNAGGGSVLGQRHGVYSGGYATVTNTGVMQGTTGDGVNLQNGGLVTNFFYAGGGSIKGVNGVYVTGGAGTVTNYDVIQGYTLDGVGLNAGGTVNNTGPTGFVLGNQHGVYGGTAAGTITVNNSGFIYGYGQGIGGVGDGVHMAAGGTVNNFLTGYIQGYNDGVYSAASGVNNAGLIVGLFDDGVHFAMGGYVNNYFAGTIVGLGGHGLNLGTGGAMLNVVQNTGLISGFVDGVYASGYLFMNNHYSATGGSVIGNNGNGVTATAGGYVVNYYGASILGLLDGVNISGAAGGWVGNGYGGASTILGVTGDGVEIAYGIAGAGPGGNYSVYSAYGGSLIQGGAGHGVSITGGLGSVYNGGLIIGSQDGVNVSNAVGLLVNRNAVYGLGGDGVNFGFGGSVANLPSASSYIRGYRHGVYGGNGGALIVVNYDRIYGLGLGGPGDGVHMAGGGIVNNYGPGYIRGANDGVYSAAGVNGSAYSSGLISGLNGHGVHLVQGGNEAEYYDVGAMVTYYYSVINIGVGSTIYGFNGDGVRIDGGYGTVANYGGSFITGTAHGVNITGGTLGYVLNAYATITGQGGDGVRLDNGSAFAGLVNGYGAFAVENEGAGGTGIYGFNGDGVFINGGSATVYNNNANITGTRHGVYTTNAFARIYNRYGLIEGFGVGGDGIHMAAGGDVYNYLGTIRGADDGVFSNGSSVTNNGLIVGLLGDGVDFAMGGTVTNNAPGQIYGFLNGVYTHGGLGTVVNSGSIYGAQGNGVRMTNSGNVRNTGGAIFGGYDNGYFGLGYVGAYAGVYINGGGNLYAGTVYQNAAATIVGTGHGLHTTNGLGAVDNFMGSITGLAGDGVRLAGGGYGYYAGYAVYNGPTSTIAGLAGDGVYINGGYTADIWNQGGLITGTINGVQVQTIASFVLNRGTVTGTADNGVYLAAGGFVFNTGAITGLGDNGVVISGGLGGTVVSYGGAATITGNTIGVNLGYGLARYSPASVPSGLGMYGMGVGGVFGNRYNFAVANYGGATITGNGGPGVYIAAGSGSVFNGAGSTITGTSEAILIGAAAAYGHVVNFGGLYSGAAFSAVAMGGNGYVYNGAAGVITGGFDGVNIAGYGVVKNLGAITGNNDDGVDIGAGGYVYNGATGTITGTGDDGVVISGAVGAVNNNGGMITGTGGNGVALLNGGAGNIYYLVNLPMVGGTDFYSVVNQNNGTINGLAGDGVYIYGGAGTVVNSAGSLIHGSDDGVDIRNVYGRVINFGTIVGDFSAGVYFDTGGYVYNALGAIIQGETFGIYVKGGAGYVKNYGKIYAASAIGEGIHLEDGGIIWNYGEIYAFTDFSIHGVSGATIVYNVLNASMNNYVGDGIDLNFQGDNVLDALLTVTGDEVRNYGYIRSHNAIGVSLNNGGAILNAYNAGVNGMAQQNGYIRGAVDGIFGGSNAADGFGEVYVLNNDTIIGDTGDGVNLTYGGEVYNVGAGANMTGFDQGVSISGGNGTVVNDQGTITGTNNEGVYLQTGDDILIAQAGIEGVGPGMYGMGGIGNYANQKYFAVANYNGATITGDSYGVRIAGGDGSVFNGIGSTIIGGTDAINFGAGVAYGHVANHGILTGTVGVGVNITGPGYVYNSAVGNITGGTDGVYILGYGVVKNLGAITGQADDGVDIRGGGYVFNSGTIYGDTTLAAGPNGGDGVFISGGAGSVQNTGGTIYGYTGDGIELADGGSGEVGVGYSVYNNGGGIIRGFADDGVFIDGGATRVFNAVGSTITGFNTGIFLTDAATGGNVNNGGTITGLMVDGVYVIGGIGLVRTAGGIYGMDDGVDLRGGGYTYNSGTIHGGVGSATGVEDGVYVSGGTGSVRNVDGTIRGYGGEGVHLSAGGTNNVGTGFGYFSVANDGGTIIGSMNNGVYIEGASGRVVNYGNGAITGNLNGVLIAGTAGYVRNRDGLTNIITGVTLDGIRFTGGGYVRNGGAVTGNLNGVNIYGGTGDVRNDGGTIIGTNTNGVYLQAGGIGGIGGFSVRNENSATINGFGGDGVLINAGGDADVYNDNTSTIYGLNNGVRVNGAFSYVSNQGAITGMNVDGVQLNLGGYVLNRDGGTIIGGNDGVEIQGGFADVVNRNASTITGLGANGVYAGINAYVGNKYGSTITGDTNGVLVLGFAEVFNSSSDIYGNGGDGINAGGGADIGSFGATSLIQGTVNGVYVTGGGAFVYNTDGDITGQGNNGVYATGYGRVDSYGATAVISGFVDGVQINGNAFVNNADGSTIIGNNGYGLEIFGNAVINNGVYVGGGSNDSDITGLGGDGIYVGGTGTIYNGAAGNDIYGFNHGIFVVGYLDFDMAGGSVLGQGFDGVHANGGADIATTGGGSIYGLDEGIEIQGGIGNVLSLGGTNITGMNGEGIYIGGGFAGYTYTTGIVLGGLNGIYISGVGNVQGNGGTITGNGGHGIFLPMGDTVNLIGGTDVNGFGVGFDGIYLGAAGTVATSGDVYGNRHGVNIGGVGTVTVNGGTVMGQNGHGIYITGGLGTVTNNGGAITGLGLDGVHLAVGGNVYNNSGTITGADEGIYSAASIIINTGADSYVYGLAGNGIELGAGGYVRNGTEGYTYGYVYGFLSGVTFAAAPAELVNHGTIIGGTLDGAELNGGGTVYNAPGATIAGAYYGVHVNAGAGTILTGGTITGGSGTAIQFDAGAAYNDSLTFYTGALLNGDVDGGLGFDSFYVYGTGTEDSNFYGFEYLGMNGADWDFTGNVFAANTYVNTGTLAINGSLTGDIIVYNGARLEGTGPIYGNVLNYGTVAPGNSIDTMVIDGNFTQDAAGNLEIEVISHVDRDLILVSGVTDIQGGTLTVDATNLDLVANNFEVIILESDLGVSGEFDDVVTFGVPDPIVTFNPNDITLSFLIDFGQKARDLNGTPNQISVGDGLTTGSIGATGDMFDIFIELMLASDGEYLPALDQLHGAPHATLQHTAIMMQDRFITEISHEARTTGIGSGFFLRGYGDMGDVKGDADGNASGLNADSYGIIGGVTGGFTDNVEGGVAVGFSTTDVGTDNDNADSDIDSLEVGAFLNFQNDNGSFFTAGGSAFWNDIKTARIIDFGALDRTALSDTNQSGWSAFAEVGRSFAMGNGGASLTPRASVRYTELSNETIEEMGAGAANLTLELMGQDSLQTFAGVGAEFPLSSRDNGPVFELDAGWIHEFNDRSTWFVATLEGAGPDHVPFAIQGAHVQRDRISTSAGIRGQMTDTVSWRLRYDGTWGDLSNHALTFGITMSR